MKSTAEQQPDIHAPTEHPSIKSYIAIGIGSSIFIFLAFAINGKPDWPALFLNISSSLLSSLVILMVIERRFRSNEISAIKKAPRNVIRLAEGIIIPSIHTSTVIARNLVRSSENLLTDYVEIDPSGELKEKLLRGCNLVSERGAGKTIWMQSIVQQCAISFLSRENKSHKLVILFPLRQWIKSEPLEDSVLDYLARFGNCSTKMARTILKKRTKTLLLDGYDEIFTKDMQLSKHISKIQSRYPALAISVSTRPNYPMPLYPRESITIKECTDAKMSEILRKREYFRHD